MRCVDRRALTAAYRAGFAALTVVAIAAQLVDLGGRGKLDLLNYFSYFTIDSNLIAVAVLVACVVGRRREPSPRLDFLRGASVVYMAVVGIVFSLLLANTDVDTALPWVNFVVHELMPIVVVVDWLIDPPAQRLTMREGLTWLAFPAVWLAYTHQGADRRQVPVPVPRPRQRWLRNGGRLLRRDPRGHDGVLRGRRLGRQCARFADAAIAGRLRATRSGRGT
jgi:hypothetical protein